MKLSQKYQKEIVPILAREYGFKNLLAAPKVTKVVVNVGLGSKKDRQVLGEVRKELSAILGQKPKVCRARQSISGFTLREGDDIGLASTLRGRKMYDFLQKLFVIVLPQVKDFRGLPLRSFDGRGNYTLGLSEQLVFPEIDLSKTKGSWSLEVTIVTNTGDDKQAKRLLELLGAPFERQEHGKKS